MSVPVLVSDVTFLVLLLGQEGAFLFDLTSPKRIEKNNCYCLFGSTIVSSPHLLATVKVFLTQSLVSIILYVLSARAPGFEENGWLASFNECRSTSESKQSMFEPGLSTSNIREELTRHDKRLLQCKQFNYIK